MYRLHQDELDAIPEETQRARRFVELNVMEQVFDVTKTSIIQNAWRIGQPLHVHGWVYDIHDGIIKDLNVTSKGSEDMHLIYQLQDHGVESVS